MHQGDFVRNQTASRAAAAALLMIAVSGVASAHTGEGAAGGFMAGIAHPLGGLDHLLAMVAVGIWGAFLGKPLIWQLPVAFPFMMVVGGALSLNGVDLPHVELGIALSVVVLGLAIAAAWRAPRPVALLIIAVFAICHGHAHGTELPEAANAAAYAAGFVLATGALHLAGIVFGLAIGSVAGKSILRVAGLAIAAMGVWIVLAMCGHVVDPPELPHLF